MYIYTKIFFHGTDEKILGVDVTLAVGQKRAHAGSRIL
jgi:hypothetical protein